jgi:hypothetical protein
LIKGVGLGSIERTAPTRIGINVADNFTCSVPPPVPPIYFCYLMTALKPIIRFRQKLVHLLESKSLAIHAQLAKLVLLMQRRLVQFDLIVALG